jgi:uncharacterized protein with HEPN domain
MKSDQLYLEHMLEAIKSVLGYAEPGEEIFFAEKMRQDAVVRNLEILGEAAKKISPALKQKHPDVPWKKIAGTRDKMIHEYFGVNLRLIWDVAEKELPKLEKKIESLLEGPTRG